MPSPEQKPPKPSLDELLKEGEKLIDALGLGGQRGGVLTSNRKGQEIIDPNSAIRRREMETSLINLARKRQSRG